jgi:hypothetical protein
LAQDIGLVPQQVRQQFNGRPKAFAGPHRSPELINRPQWTEARTDQHTGCNIQTGGGDRRGVEFEVEQHIMQHRDQRISLRLQTRRTYLTVQ